MKRVWSCFIVLMRVNGRTESQENEDQSYYVAIY